MNAEPAGGRRRLALALVGELLDLPAAERADRLDAVCGDDGVLRREVKALLAAHGSAEPLFAALERQRDEVLAEAPPAELPPALQRVGPWRLIRELGSGGMGVVYLAERADGDFEQHAALKLVRRGLDHENLLRRFLQERQILARLEHPAIARLLDGGRAPDGRPYFALELVDGLPITRFADERRLGVEERLSLFREVCGAVHDAHRRLIVHRDLKPSNILVTSEGRPKLLDFGIAKLLADAGVESTISGVGLPLTPAYAAPEQLRGEAVTTATDVWALGVLLYELLAGRHPFTAGGVAGVDLTKAILAAEPLRPSAAAFAAGPEAAAARRSTPGRLRRRLEEDLDTIILMALRKEPDRRYASAEALANDVTRHLEGRPVAAAAGARGYRAWKFVRRHRLGAAAAAIVVLSLVGALVAAAWQARTTARAAARANAVQEFLIDVFQGASPERGASVTARELLDRGVQRIDSELAGQPTVQADLLGVIGSAYAALGLHDRAAPLFERAVALRRRGGGKDGVEVAEALAGRAAALGELRSYPQSIALYKEALAIRRRRLGAADPLVGQTLADLGREQRRAGRLVEAEATLGEALAASRRAVGDGHPLVARSRAELGALRLAQGRPAEAEAELRQALEVHRRGSGAGSADALAALDGLAAVLAARGDLDGAEDLAREGLELRRGVLPPDHLDLAQALERLASPLARRGAVADAEPLLREALEIRRRSAGPRDPSTGVALAALAEVLGEQGKLAQAESLWIDALAVGRAHAGEGDGDGAAPLVARPLLGLAALRREQGRYTEAEILYRDAHDLLARTVGEDHPETLRTVLELGVLAHRRGDLARAVGLLRGALAGREARLGPSDSETAAARIALAALLRDQGSAAESEVQAARALEDLLRTQPRLTPAVAEALLELGRTRCHAGRHTAGEENLQEALALRESGVGPAWRAAEARLRLAECLELQARPAEAQTLAAEALPTLRATRGEEHPLTIAARALATGAPT